jgi:alkanesulfonate monooxygenase SsuD/methylene tetrahydromethanopterin reductase-like flavin-dependent oxidoreductase (luciferase family)
MFVDPDRVRPIMHCGSYFTVRGPLNVPRPIQGHPVIMLHDRGSGALRDAVLPFVDVLLCDLSSREEMVQFRADLQSRASPSTRASPPLIIKSAMPILARTEREALQRADELAALGSDSPPFFVGTPAGLADELSHWLALGACDGFDLRPAVNTRDLDLIVEAITPALRPVSLRDFDRRSTLRHDLHLARPA